MKTETGLTRAQLRYQCYSMREQGKSDSEFKSLLKDIEKLPHFDGWYNFAMTWDFVVIGDEKILVLPLKLRWKKFSESKEWEVTVDKLATNKKSKLAFEFKDGPKSKN